MGIVAATARRSANASVKPNRRPSSAGSPRTQSGSFTVAWEMHFGLTNGSILQGCTDRRKGGELTSGQALARTTVAYAVSTPLIGGGVAEWLKAAVC
jgi:hypothetical protein